MKEYLKKLPKEIQNLISTISGVASSNDAPVYLVGGFVRDLLLGVKNLDLDIVVEGGGIKFAEDLASVLKAKIIRHKRFGTATLTVKPHLKIDIATARKEFYPHPASLPVVSSGMLKDDLFRRDFTINAMAIDITDKNFGELIDLFGGKRDLGNKKVRILHIASFEDDPTRMLRAIRFEKRYNFKIEPVTLKLLKAAARIRMLQKVQPQRTRDELILDLKERCPLSEIRRVQGLVGFDFIKCGLKISEKTYGLMRSLEKEIRWFQEKYPARRQPDTWLIYLMCILDSVGAVDIKDICRRFAFRRGETKRMLDYKRINRKFILSLSLSKIKPSKIFSLLEPLSYEGILLLKAKYKNRLLQKHIEDFFEIYNGMRTYICGHDLHRLGLMPGPHYQTIFAKVLNAKLNGLVRTKEEELALIKKLVKK